MDSPGTEKRRGPLRHLNFLSNRTKSAIANRSGRSQSTSKATLSEPKPSTSSVILPSPPSSTHRSVSPAGQSAPPAAALSQRDFLNRALELIPQQEQNTIQEHTLNTTEDIGLALEEAFTAARDKRHLCEHKRWTFAFRGRTFRLRDEADRVVLWLDRFKQVGDIAANADPIHAGLPWAGIRLLLEAAVSDSRQMAGLLVGLNIALYMMNRLKVYMEYLSNLPAAKTRTNFEYALIAFHATILKFLARAIRIYRKNTVARAFDAFWKLEEVSDFETECDKIGARVEIEASNCDRTLSVLQRAAAIQQKLPSAKGASFDSYQNEHDPKCLENTRVELLHQIATWVEDVEGKCIFWLNGMAGTGKSTISRTVAQSLLEKGQLGASFFFKRGEGDRRNASRFFTTIAAQLAINAPDLARSMAKVIDENPDVSKKAMKEQFEKLILQPLSNTMYAPDQASTLAIVIDALDECEQEQSIRTILRLLARAKDIRPVRLRIFVTSRPELPIRLGFLEMSRETHQDVVLHETPKETIEHDIYLYLKYEFNRIRTENSEIFDLGPDWPGDEDTQALVVIAAPLFIFAATVCRFVGDSRWNPKERLDYILEHRTASRLSNLDETYLFIVKKLVFGQEKEENEQLAREFREIVGTTANLADSLSVTSLAGLLDIPVDKIRTRLNLLHSVLNIPTSKDAPVKLLHLSFRDFLINPRIRDKTSLWVDESATHEMIATKCIELLSGPWRLTENMCNLKNPAKLRIEIDKQTIDTRLPAHVKYACQYWVYHLEQSKGIIKDQDRVHHFLEEYFLYWLEALSLIENMSEAVVLVSTLQGLATSSESSGVSAFLSDARRFVLKNRRIVDRAPLQLYSSLAFAPESSIIRNNFKHLIPGWFCVLPKVEATWGTLLETLEGHYGSVSSVAFSHDSTRLASASDDRTVKIWDTGSAECLWTLSGHNSAVNSVAFSHDSARLASGSDDETVKIWDVNGGECLQTLDGHSSHVTSVTFSHNSTRLASASTDTTVKIWRVRSNECLQTLEGHRARVNSVAFSHGSAQLVSASDDGTVKIWDTGSAECLWTLSGHSSAVNSVAFSHDSARIASGSADDTVKIWDARSGEWLQTFEGHGDHVSSVAFSHDSTRLASSSDDKTVKIWDLDSSKCLQTLASHNDYVDSVAFSHDSLRLTSASRYTIQIWDANTSDGFETLERHNNSVRSVAFSYDTTRLASASYDTTIKIWDASSGECLKTLHGHGQCVRSVAFSQDSTQLASASYDNAIKIWDTSSGKCLQTIETGDIGVTHSVSFSRDLDRLVSTSFDYTPRIWDKNNGNCLQMLQGHSRWVRSANFSNDSTRIVSGSDDKTVKIWDTESGECLHTLEGHDSYITSVNFSNDSTRIVSASQDKTIRIWDANSGECLQTLDTGKMLSDISFDSTGSLIHTSIGTIDIRPSTSSNIDSTIPKFLFKGPALSFDEEWITYDSENLVWLPLAYRPAWSAVSKNMIAVGGGSGKVWACKVDMNKS